MDVKYCFGPILELPVFIRGDNSAHLNVSLRHNQIKGKQQVVDCTFIPRNLSIHGHQKFHVLALSPGPKQCPCRDVIQPVSLSIPSHNMANEFHP